MHEIDKAAFGMFLAEVRKEKGWTQKELAQKLYVSDKAVSKWERGLSLPDISLLIPLSETLGVTATELLEARRVEAPKPMEPEQVEALVKKALTLSEEPPAPSRKWRKGIFFAALAAVALELLTSWVIAGLSAILDPAMGGLEGLSIGFGCYFWLFMKDRLPDYYDENKINTFSDGIFRMNVPGVSFNNSNWPRIGKVLRIWSLVTMLALPLLSLGLTLIPMPQGISLTCRMLILGGYLLGLFLPVYFAAFEKRPKGESREIDKQKVVTALAVLLLVLLAALFGGKSFGVIRIGYIAGKTPDSWAAGYYLLTGTEVQSFQRRGTRDFVLEVVTEKGSLSVDIQDRDGVAFSRKNLPTGEYPVTLDGSFEVAVHGKGHKGRFRIAPAP